MISVGLGGGDDADDDVGDGGVGGGEASGASSQRGVGLRGRTSDDNLFAREE